MRLRSVLALSSVVVGLNACGGSSCFGTHAPPSTPSPPAPKPSPLPPPRVHLRDYLYPRRVCTTTLERSDDHATEVYSYATSRDAKGRERVTVTVRTTDAHGTHTTAEAFTISDTIEPVAGDGTALPAEVKNLDLMTATQRIVSVTDTVDTPQGKLGPCVTALSRLDKEKTFRTYRTWCKGIGLTRVDQTEGKKRVYTELKATTCP